MHPTPEHVCAIHQERLRDADRHRLSQAFACRANTENLLSRIGRSLRIRSTAV